MKALNRSLRVILMAALLVGISGMVFQLGAETGKIDVNKATVEQLAELKGIGPVIAKRIVDYREKNGPYTDMEQLQEVKGIGPKTLSRIADRITFQSSSE